MSNWWNEVFENETEYLIEHIRDEVTRKQAAQARIDALNQIIERASVNDHGEPIPAVMKVLIDRFAPTKENDIIEPTYYSRGCKICGSITGEHGFSFSQKQNKR